MAPRLSNCGARFALVSALLMLCALQNNSNMRGYEKNLKDNRVVFKYIEPGSCYLHEVGGCVGGTGWCV